MTLLFLQLPRLDPDTATPGENLMLASACLTAALERSEEACQWTLLATPADQDTADDATLIAALRTARPDVVAATCYLWNIERTLHLLACLRKHLPHLKIILGGPEIADRHPLLKPRLADALCIGEGEPIFPALLRHLREERSGPRAKKPAVRIYRANEAPPIRLTDALPAPDHPINRPDAFGMAYLETHRGCPLRCAFCCYNLRRSHTTCLDPEEVAQRIRILRQRGAKEIRLVDPTFNAHPRFEALLNVMAQENPDRKIAFFVEIRADTLTDDQARRLAQAGVTEAEVGIQSTDPAVLRILHRPLDEKKVWRGITALLRHGIKPTLDFMYALPRQDGRDLQRSLAWLARFGEAIHPQFLPTLLLPGTELRDRAKALGLRAQKRPPYRVLATDRLSARQLAKVEREAAELLGGFDSPTPRFVGARLSGLFPEKGGVNRRRLTFNGPGLFERAHEIAAQIQACLQAEPHILWQFVLKIEEEEPLDLFDPLVAAIRNAPGHWLDRLVSPPDGERRVARRLFVQLPRKKRSDPGWIDEAERSLREIFH